MAPAARSRGSLCSRCVDMVAPSRAFAYLRDADLRLRPGSESCHGWLLLGLLLSLRVFVSVSVHDHLVPSSLPHFAHVHLPLSLPPPACPADVSVRRATGNLAWHDTPSPCIAGPRLALTLDGQPLSGLFASGPRLGSGFLLSPCREVEATLSRSAQERLRMPPLTIMTIIKTYNREIYRITNVRLRLLHYRRVVLLFKLDSNYVNCLVKEKSFIELRTCYLAQTRQRSQLKH